MNDPASNESGGAAVGRVTETQLAVWQTMAARRSGYDLLMWQTPALGMTAQAFLLTLALGHDSTRWARLISALLSMMLSLMVMQLMAKHRRNEMLESLRLRELEDRFGMAKSIGFLPHDGPEKRDVTYHQYVHQRLRRTTPGPIAFWKMGSYALWMYGLWLFTLVAAAIVVLALAGIARTAFGAP